MNASFLTASAEVLEPPSDTDIDIIDILDDEILHQIINNELEEINKIITGENEDLKTKAWISDVWTRVIIIAVVKFIRNSGSEKINIIETGTGGGSIIRFLIRNLGERIKKIYGIEIDKGVLDNTERRFKEEGYDNIVTLIHSNLFKSVKSEVFETLNNSVNIACLPHVIFLGKEKPANFYGNYYDTKEIDGEESDLDKVGLKLLYYYLKEAQEKTPNSNVIINFAGRISEELIFEIFENFGYKPEILHEEVVKQCTETELKMFVEYEENYPNSDYKGQFFSDSKGENNISAIEAQKMVNEGIPVYHKLFAILGVPENEDEDSSESNVIPFPSN